MVTFARFIPFVCFLGAALIAVLVWMASGKSLEASNDVSIAFLLLGLLIILALHVLTPTLDPINQMVSEYALEKPYGTFMRIAFYWLAVGTVNLSIVLRHAGLGIWISIFAGGCATAFMGVFSQKSSDIDNIKNTETEGHLHSISVSIAFGLAAFSMWLFPWHPDSIIQQKIAWSQGFALALFTITLLSLLIFLVLALRKIPLVRKQTGLTMRELLKEDGSRHNPFHTTAVQHPRSKLARPELRSLIQANAGMGLTERILIFLFIEWELNLCWLLHTLRAQGAGI